MKKKMKNKSAKRATKPKAKKAKVAMKTKSKPKKLIKTAPKKKSKGLSVVELYNLKNKHAQATKNPSGDEWKHKKDLPPHEQHGKEELHGKVNRSNKKSGFGGIRHH